MLLVNTLVTMVTMTRARTDYLVMLDETSCYQCQDPDGCQDQVVGAGQVRDGLNWTLERLDSLNIVNRDSYSKLKTQNICSNDDFHGQFYSNIFSFGCKEHSYDQTAGRQVPVGLTKVLKSLEIILTWIWNKSKITPPHHPLIPLIVFN